jgi:hypothetical protein
MPATNLSPELPTQPAEQAVVTAAPPAAHAASAWQQFTHALGWPQRARRRPIVASEARAAFVNCLADVPTLQAQALSERLSHTQSLSELWHLRPAVFQVLALHHSQAEAERRLIWLGERFDRRSQPRAPGTPTRPR